MFIDFEWVPCWLYKKSTRIENNNKNNETWILFSLTLEVFSWKLLSWIELNFFLWKTPYKDLSKRKLLTKTKLFRLTVSRQASSVTDGLGFAQTDLSKRQLFRKTHLFRLTVSRQARYVTPGLGFAQTDLSNRQLLRKTHLFRLTVSRQASSVTRGLGFAQTTKRQILRKTHWLLP